MLEHNLLVNRKKRCWDRYHNNSLGDPRYVDQWGPNNHFYGKTHTEEVRKKLSETKKYLEEILIKFKEIDKRN